MESACQAEACLIPGSGRAPEEENGSPLQYSCLEKSQGQRNLAATVHGVTESGMTERLSTLTHILL